MAELNLEKNMAGLSAEARARVELALKDALGKEGALGDAKSAFDRGPFDRSGYDRSSKAELLKDVVDPDFVDKGVTEKVGRTPR